MDNTATAISEQKKCFVVMGFGIKTDLATGRQINLDDSYRAFIKPVIVAKGWLCIRADEIPHSNMIDVEMYKQLLTSDIVIADLSTSNVNAFYELGIRYALRPRNTIVISEDRLCYPFDLNHIPISTYKLNSNDNSINYFEVVKFQENLSKLLDAIQQNNGPDSPVYTLLGDLISPPLSKAIEKDIKASAATATVALTNASYDSRTMHDIVNDGEDALSRKDYPAAKRFFTEALTLANSSCKSTNASSPAAPVNTYLTQRLAYITYKTREPDKVAALKEAAGILSVFDLKNTNDTETVLLAGRIEKKLFLNGEGEEHLEKAIEYHERAYFLLGSRYNAINLAFLFNNRAASNLSPTNQDKITDMVLANRLRSKVLQLCDEDLKKVNTNAGNSSEGNEVKHLRSQGTSGSDALFWIFINKAEACYGLGSMTDYKHALADAQAVAHEEYKMDRFEKQRQRLQDLLVQYGNLLSPVWVAED